MEQTDLQGLDDQQVLASRKQYGSNRLTAGQDGIFWSVLREVVTEPMFLLLTATGTLYFILREYTEGIIMILALCLVAAISLWQEYRSRQAISLLRDMSAPRCRVIRQGREQDIPADDLVVGDLLKLSEGELVAADGELLQANDFSVNEAILTGESFPVYKDEQVQRRVYRGTLVTSGYGLIRLTAVGNRTMAGEIGVSAADITPPKTPLQTQIRSFVRRMVIFGFIAFLLVFLVEAWYTSDWLEGLFRGLTLAMSVLPEEIPVAFSTFMALGAFRLIQRQMIVKHPQSVETLGSATVICTDKTGTLTENRMQVAVMYAHKTGTSWDFLREETDAQEKNPAAASMLELISYAMWASERDPFDPMEKAIHQLYEQLSPQDLRPGSIQVHEYPISGKPPMMTHIFRLPDQSELIAAKGAPEAILALSNVDEDLRTQLYERARMLAGRGFRVLGVGRGIPMEQGYPAMQQDYRFEFLGLLAFLDPAKPNIAEVIRSFDRAGIQVKIITGDYAETTQAIAEQVGLPGSKSAMTGQEVLTLSAEELKEKVGNVTIFARMFPEAKLQVIEALKARGEVVAMTGDGVNDGPALKAAHIGIAMGKRGSELAKSSASLILTDDDLSHMIEAVAIGRKIYDNLKKAIRYIISIHIPIILIVLLPILLGWMYRDIFSPIHVIFLELIMGPTCSVIYENEPMEPGTMLRKPRKMTDTFLNLRELGISIIQGLVITLACLGIGYYMMVKHEDAALMRTHIFITLLFCNVLLTLENRSFRESLFTTLRYRNSLMWIILTLSVLLILTCLYIPWVMELFRLTAMPIRNILICLIIAVIATSWMEIPKWWRRR